MALKELDNSNISKHLGKASNYVSTYDPSLLVREPRSSNRKHLGLKDEDLPFRGFDTWDGYEVSSLTLNGAPVTAVAKVVYSCDSPYIVESKSMKLYWNSFNMSKWGPNKNAVYENLKYYGEKDLSDLLQTKVEVSIVDPKKYFPLLDDPLFGSNSKYFNETTNIDDVADYIKCSVYSETPELLIEDGIITYPKSRMVCYDTSILKSNCRVTSQPDWGDIFIIMKGIDLPTKESLFKYITSFRDECHFHEEIVECIMTRLLAGFDPQVLVVCGKYVRRGGWGITPLRYYDENYSNGTHSSEPTDKELINDINNFRYADYLVKTARQ
jgi:7-cyano-7-deazaguanine reductase